MSRIIWVLPLCFYHCQLLHRFCSAHLQAWPCSFTLFILKLIYFLRPPNLFMFYAATLSVLVLWKKYLHKNKSEFNIQNNGLQCTSVQAAVKAPPGRMQLYSRHSIIIHIGTLLRALNTNLLHFIKIFYFYELLVVFKKHIRSDSNWWMKGIVYGREKQQWTPF